MWVEVTCVQPVNFLTSYWKFATWGYKEYEKQHLTCFIFSSQCTNPNDHRSITFVRYHENINLSPMKSRGGGVKRLWNIFRQALQEFEMNTIFEKLTYPQIVREHEGKYGDTLVVIATSYWSTDITRNWKADIQHVINYRKYFKSLKDTMQNVHDN